MAPKTVREINTANRLRDLADADMTNLEVFTRDIVDPDPLMPPTPLGPQIRTWFAGVDQAYNSRVAAARDAGTLDQVPARPTTPAMWPPQEGDVWITRHGWTWEMVGDRMVSDTGMGVCRTPVEWFRGDGPVLMRRDGVGVLGEVLRLGVGV